MSLCSLLKSGGHDVAKEPHQAISFRGPSSHLCFGFISLGLLATSVALSPWKQGHSFSPESENSGARSLTQAEPSTPATTPVDVKALY